MRVRTVRVRPPAGGLLAEARALRAAFPDGAAMRRVPACAGGPPDSGADAELAAALRYSQDEVAVVRTGRADSLTVLDDEIANVERLTRPAYAGR